MNDQSIARRAGRVLENYPQLHALVKAVYFHANWALRPQSSLINSTMPGYEIISPAQWAGTPEPAGHLFFGYYDKSPWSPDGTRFLLHSLGRPRHSEDISVLVLDASSHDCRTVARSSAWNYQQGSLTQWIRWQGVDAVALNDITGGQLVTRIVSTDGNELAKLERPIQCSTRDGDIVASISLARLSVYRPEYGYSRLRPGPLPSLEHDGLFLLSAGTGTWSLRVSLDQLVSHQPLTEFATSAHWLNHVAFAPGGSRLVFLHRWGDRRRQRSRLYLLDLDSAEPRLLLDGGLVSHYCWLDDRVLLCYCESSAGYRYHLINTCDLTVKPVETPTIAALSDGHPSFCPNTGQIVTDTYPNRYGQQQLLVFHRNLAAATTAATVTHPPKFRGAARCDLHPRWHQDGRAVSFDSVMNGRRRSWILRTVVHED